MIFNVCIAIIGSFFANRICNKRAKLIKHTPLPDLLHQLIKPIPHYVPDILLVLSLLGLIFQKLNWDVLFCFYSIPFNDIEPFVIFLFTGLLPTHLIVW